MYELCHLLNIFVDDLQKEYFRYIHISDQKFSGDVVYVLNPATLSYGKKGSSHGSGFNYDTHVPLLFFGAGIKQGETYEKTVIPDISPTISSLLGTSFPNMATGRPLSEVLK